MKPQLDLDVTLEHILAARARIQPGIAETPCPESPALSALNGGRIFCKREDLQPTGSFKERGARNALALLTEPEARRGVLAASAGNHALGLAWHGRALGIPVTVIMPRSAARVKIDRCRALGARVLLHGDDFDQARSHAANLALEWSVPNIHPFDDPAVIAGQGTIALEIVQQVPRFDAILVPVGGGGLLAGVAMVLRELRPDVTIIGVEPEHAPCFSRALARGQSVLVPTRPTLADGLAVARAGNRALRIAAPRVDRVVTLGEPALAAAMACLAQTEGAVVEGAGAAPLAALLDGQLPELAGKQIVFLITGRNIDPAVHNRVVRMFPLGERRPSALCG